MAARKPAPKPVMVKLRYRHDGAYYHVWNETWSGDQFEVMDNTEFSQLQKTCATFGIKLEEYFDEDDN